jgi:hypothetical protein
MTRKRKSNVHYNIQHDVMCFVPWPQIMLDVTILNLICFDLLNDWIKVYS